ncbi:MAG: DUF5060 domain-containing protein [Victivallales bacterium]|nr:DUF5060 domain-containing protein [Victivallales bacterium]
MKCLPRLPILLVLLGTTALAGLREGLPQEAGVPSVGQPILATSPAERFARLEFDLPLKASYTNPFDPDDIRADAHIRLPDGQIVVVPAFYYQGWEPESGKTQMQLWIRYRRLADQDGWRLRFAPAQVGEHQVHIVMRRRKGRPISGPQMTFSVADSARPGFIRASVRNAMYFEDSGTGEPFVGIGANVAWTRAQDPGDPLPSYEYYFGKAKGKMNATRVWLCHWAWLEWTPAVKAPETNWAGYAGLGYYNQQIAVALDRVFRLASDAGLRVMLVTEDNNEHFGQGKSDQWAANPYNRKNGGPCEKPQDIFGSTEARTWYRKRLRYIVARWGAETALWAINSWNDCSTPNEDQLSWLREMRDHVHALTKGWRPLVYGSNLVREANAEMDYAQAGAALRTDRPNVTQECHYTTASEWFRPVLRQQLWQGLAAGKAAVMVWPHVTVDRTNAWDTFRPVMELGQTLPLLEGTWGPVTVEVAAAETDGEPPYRTLIELGAYGDVPDWGHRATHGRFDIQPEQGDQWLTGYCRNLYGTSRKAWQRPPTLAFALPAPGALILDAQEIGGGTQILEATVDGTLAKKVTLAKGRRSLRDDERWIRIPLATGKHEVRLDNAGQDWLRLRKLYLAWDNPSAGRLVQVTGRTNGDVGFAYVRNLTHSRVAQEVLRQKPLELRNVSLRLKGLATGARYAIRVIDPETGEDRQKLTVASSAVGLPITLDRLAVDAVIRFEKSR